MNEIDAIAVSITTLDEVARAISELRFRRGAEDFNWPIAAREHEALRNLFRLRAVAIGLRVNGGLCDLVASIIIEAMVAQETHDRNLASYSQPLSIENGPCST